MKAVLGKALATLQNVRENNYELKFLNLANLTCHCYKKSSTLPYWKIMYSKWLCVYLIIVFYQNKQNYWYIYSIAGNLNNNEKDGLNTNCSQDCPLILMKLQYAL